MSSLKRLIINGGLVVLAAVVMLGNAFAASPLYLKVQFSLPPGGSKVIPLPVGQVPINVLVSFTLKNGSTQIPSELMAALVNEDPSSHQLTWIGTNSDGTQAAGTTLGNHLIASIAQGNVNLSAETPTAGAPNGSLVVSQSSTQTIRDGYYIVTLVY